MKIIFLTLGNENIASSRTRVFQYLPYFKNRKMTCFVHVYSPNISLDHNNIVNRLIYRALLEIKLLIFFLHSLFFDVVFIQKVFLPTIYTDLFKKLHKILIFDFDDAVQVENKGYIPIAENIKKFNHIVAKANLIIIENDYNLAYVNKFNSNVLKIVGPIEKNRYFPIRKTETKLDGSFVTIGWIGSPTTTMYLDSITDVFQELSARYAGLVTFATIGAGDFKISGVEIKNHQWSLETEVELLQSFDIGIMPLFDDEWSKGKGGYKLLQYMSIGIPSVASPVGVNCEIIQHGKNGFLAKDNRDWIELLSKLIDDKMLRLEMGIQARKMIEEKYTFEINSQLILDKINLMR